MGLIRLKAWVNAFKCPNIFDITIDKEWEKTKSDNETKQISSLLTLHNKTIKIKKEGEV